MGLSGSARDQGWFWIGVGRGPVKRVMLTESPIDAMSLAVIDTGYRDRDGVWNQGAKPLLYVRDGPEGRSLTIILTGF